MKPSKEMQTSVIVNRILLGLVVLIPGLTKLFVMGPEKVAGFLGSLGFPLATLFAIVLIFSEIVFGITIIIGYKLRYTAIPPMIIMIVAGLTTALPKQDWGNLLMHLALAAGYWTFSAWGDKEM